VGAVPVHRRTAADTGRLRRRLPERRRGRGGAQCEAPLSGADLPVPATAGVRGREGPQFGGARVSASRRCCASFRPKRCTA
jgi:hypothetical protein